MPYEPHMKANRELAPRGLQGPRVTPVLSRLALLVWLAGLLPTQSPAQIPGVYQVDTASSHIQIVLYRGGFLGALTDNHLIILHTFSGVADLPKDSPWRVEMQGQSASLKVEDPGSSEADRKSVQEAMDGPDQLDTSHYPLIKLRSISFQPTEQDTVWHLLADVTLHGATRQEEFPLECHQTGDRLQVRGEKMLLLRDFNIKPISRIFGAIKVENEFKVKYEIVLERNH